MSICIVERSDSQLGNELILFRLHHASGSYVEVLNYGATLVSIVVPDKNNRFENVILKYNEKRDYLSDTFYIGSTIGRFANRIGGASFELDGQIFHLEENDGRNSNHGGFNGFNRKFFDYRIENDSLVLYIESPDGEGGFPGNLSFSVKYSFNDFNELDVEYKAISDQNTIFNPTNHAYFDLSAGRQSPLEHELKVFSDSYLEADDEFLPTGNILPVYETAFDFRDYRSISGLMPLKKEIIKGYNAYFTWSETTKYGGTRILASLREKESGRMLEVHSNFPGVMLYTGDYLSGRFPAFGGICLEAQLYPDAPNHKNFPSCVLKSNQEMTYKLQYKFLLSC